MPVPGCVDILDASKQAFLNRVRGGSPAMPAFLKNPKVIIGTLVVLWVAYVIYANFPKVVDFTLLPFGVVLQFALSTVVAGSAVFGALVTIVIQWLWRRRSKNSAPTGSLAAPSSKTVA
jgi:hypothetical protein